MSIVIILLCSRTRTALKSGKKKVKNHKARARIPRGGIGHLHKIQYIKYNIQHTRIINSKHKCLFVACQCRVIRHQATRSHSLFIFIAIKTFPLPHSRDFTIYYNMLLFKNRYAWKVHTKPWCCAILVL